MGNQLIKGYSIDRQPKGQAGVNNLWKLYDGTKQGTNQQVSIFIIDKKALKKSEKDQIIKLAKKEPTALAKFKHPGILSLAEPLLQDEHSLAFVVQRVEGNLQHFIKTNRLSQICSSELQIRLQLFPLLQTLHFVHSNVKMAHLALNPENIYLMPDGKWKLSGFSFSQPININSTVPYDGRQIDYSYLSPQMVLEDRCTYVSDTFSLMHLVLNMVRAATVKKEWRQLINASSRTEYERFKEIVNRIDSHPFVMESTNSPALARLARDAMQWDMDKRMSIIAVAQSDWMNDNFILTIKHLENIMNLEQRRQLDFIKGMEQVLFRFETAIIKKRIIPTLIGLLKFDYLIAVLLIVLVEILKKDILNASEFQKILWGPIKALTNSKQIPAHALYVLVDNIELWSKYMSFADLNTTIIPLYVKCFDCPNKLKELALKKVEFLSKKFDYQFLKTKILPRLLNLMTDKTYDIRKYTLIALYKIMALFDSQTISDQILVGLQKNRRSGTDPFINAITLKLYAEFSKNLNVETIGNKIIPSLIPYLTDSSITKNDFEMYKTTILSLINRIQQQRSKNFSIADGVYFNEADFDFPSEEKSELPRPAQQPNFDFLTTIKEPPKPEPTPVIQQQPQSYGNPLGPSMSTPSIQTYNPTPTPTYSPPVSTNIYEPPKIQAPIYTPPTYSFQPKVTSSELTGFEFLGTMNRPQPPKVDSALPPFKPQTVQQPKKHTTIQEAANDFFSSLDVSPPQPPSPAKPPAFKGPPQRNLAPPPSSTPSYNPPPPSNPTFTPPPAPQINLNLGGMNLYGTGITMNTGGQPDPFAELQAQMKTRNAPPPPPTNFSDIQFLSQPPGIQSPPKPTIKKPGLKPPPTTNVASINNDDFFDLL